MSGVSGTRGFYHRRSMARVPAVLLALLALALFAGACGDDDDSGSTAAQAESTETPAAASDEQGCKTVEAPEPKPDGDLAKPKGRLDRSKTTVAKVTTNCGEFEITLDAKDAPKTGASFAHLAREGFYDGLIFHRIVPGFVIQGGDPTGTGEGGSGYSVVEAPPRDLAYEKGVVAMAKTEAEAPGTSGSQFFVVTAEDAQLPPDYALVGRVTKGQEVVDKIGVVPTGADDRPVDPVVIEKIEVEER
jgi:cyclophilin family peptidyl-prolyl cis-trans isomerase